MNFLLTFLTIVNIGFFFFYAYEYKKKLWGLIFVFMFILTISAAAWQFSQDNALINDCKVFYTYYEEIPGYNFTFLEKCNFHPFVIKSFENRTIPGIKWDLEWGNLSFS